MKKFAFTITDCFLIKGVGLLVTSGIGNLNPPLRIGDQLRLHRPDGSDLESAVNALHLLHAPNPILNPFLALAELQPSDVPPGTEVWVESPN